ncbi:hypothetical protein LV779_26030 [Streptomyces thinghirensis]|nr:hypothetical protein [Streptomyces thinghirensis]
MTPSDRDAVTYWRDWTPDTDGAVQERALEPGLRRHDPRIRPVERPVSGDGGGRGHGRVGGRAPEPRGHPGTAVLTVADLLTTLGVEATVHHLDLTVALPTAPGPSLAGLTAVRATLDGLLGRPGAAGLERRALRPAPPPAAHRLTESERHALGPDADRVPLFG